MIQLLLILLAFGIPLDAETDGNPHEVAIPMVEKMPNLPQPYKMKDWGKTVHDYDQLVFDPGLKGEHCPIVKILGPSPNYPGDAFMLPSYLGPTSEANEGWTVLGNLYAMSCAGIDKTKGAMNWVTAAEHFFNRSNGENLVLDASNTRAGISACYDIIPGVLFGGLVDRYPNEKRLAEAMRVNADRWLEAIDRMKDASGKTSFFYTAFDFTKKSPQYNGIHREADSASGLAMIEFMAYRKFGEAKYLEATRRSLDWWSSQRDNYGYEMMHHYAPLVAARLNADYDGHYNLLKLIHWCVSRSDTRPEWSVTTTKSDGIDCSGLLGAVGCEITGNNESQFYAFAGNAFNLQGFLVPVARYDKRFARAIAKLYLNAANSSRLFYPGERPRESQSVPNWTHNDKNCIPYEGLRNDWEGSPLLYASGDPIKHHWPYLSDLGLYGGGMSGIFAAIQKTTDVEGILELNLLATDVYRDRAYPSFLYYNPYPEEKTVHLPLGEGSFDLYEMKSETVIQKAVQGTATVRIPADAAIILVRLPSGSLLEKKGRKWVSNGIIVDYGYSDLPLSLPIPEDSPKGVEIENDSNLFVVRSNFESNPKKCQSAADGDMGTSLQSKENQKEGDFIEVDFSEPVSITRFEIRTGRLFWQSPEFSDLERWDENKQEWIHLGEWKRGFRNKEYIDSNDLEKSKRFRWLLKGSRQYQWSVAEMALWKRE